MTLNKPKIFQDIDNINTQLGEKAKRVYVTPEEFGAVGDGITDDSTAMQNCLNIGKAVMFSKGKTYGVYEITVPSNTTIYGNGAVIKTLSGSSGANENALFRIDNSNVTIQNVIFDGNYDNVAGSELSGVPLIYIGLRSATTVDNIKLFNCNFINNKYVGVKIAKKTSNVFIDNCKSNNTDTVVILMVDTAKNISITNCKFDGGTSECICMTGTEGDKIIDSVVISENIFQNKVNSYGVILRNSESTLKLTNITITNNVIKGNAGGIDVESSDALISGNLINNVNYGITIKGDISTPKITNNKFYGCIAKCIDKQNATSMEISGNYFNVNDGVSCVYGNYFTFNNNYVENCSRVCQGNSINANNNYIKKSLFHSFDGGNLIIKNNHLVDSGYAFVNIGTTGKSIIANNYVVATHTISGNEAYSLVLCSFTDAITIVENNYYDTCTKCKVYGLCVWNRNYFGCTLELDNVNSVVDKFGYTYTFPITTPSKLYT